MPDFATFDRRGYPSVDPRTGYGAWSSTYEASVEDIMDLGLLDQVASIDWRSVDRAADLGCGTGRTAAWLVAHGVACVDGIDLTPEMVAIARTRGNHRSLSVADVRSTGLRGRSYDLVICSLVDEHLATLTDLYREGGRLLGDGGAFVLVGYHPFFMMATGMPTHFDDRDGRPVAIETHIHLLSEHVAAATAAELTLTELHERVVDDEWVERKPKWERHRGWPISLASVWRR